MRVSICLLGLALLQWFPASIAQAREPNHLAGSTSPYLLQHLYNPVDWYPWSDEALERARQENKPIFVSVGYSACHWCHVMARESFEDEAIAEVLNAEFVSIKIDRETRPDLDMQFSAVTELLVGSSGWPNSVFLTPEGDPYFAAGYQTPEDFTATLHQLAAAWHDDPAFVAGEAAKVTAAVATRLTALDTLETVTPDQIEAATDAIIEEIDPFYGGLGVAPKFPREMVFLYLLDQADRKADPELLATVQETLDAMLRGGIHDHVWGGFHRYATETDWSLPHFEKMLYNQALIGKLLTRAYRMTGEFRYRRGAERLFDHILRDMQAADGGFYATLDADSITEDGARIEGLYYAWSREEIVALGDRASLAAAMFQIEPHGLLDGRSVLQMPEHADELAAEVEGGAAVFYGGLDSVLEEMRGLKPDQLAPFRDEKLLVSWNGLMISSLVEASREFERPDYRDAAIRAADRLWESYAENGRFVRVLGENTEQIEGQLPDYAAAGLAMIALSDTAPNANSRAHWLSRASSIADQIRARFATSGGAYRLLEEPDGLTEILPLDDTTIPSGNALVLELFARLSERAEDVLMADEVAVLASLGGAAAVQNPFERAGLLHAAIGAVHGNLEPVQSSANGKVYVTFERQADGTAELVLSIEEGWHVNANTPFQDYLIPTEVSIDGELASASYPKYVVKETSFSDAGLALYEGRTIIRLPKTDKRPARVSVSVQACSDEICLLPDELSFTWW